jgi:hypothetical protein
LILLLFESFVLFVFGVKEPWCLAALGLDGNLGEDYGGALWFPLLR